MNPRGLLAIFLALCFLEPAAASGAAPPLSVPHVQLGQVGSGVPANLLLNLSLTFEDAGAAYRDAYAAGTEYAGYFNPRLCYGYPLASKEPDLSPEHGYFSPTGQAGAGFECGGGSFSGNLLNWAATSTLDLLRYGLTGGDRVIDEPGLTVLQRAWLPDGAVNPDFYAHPVHFARKQLAAADAARLTPFGSRQLYIVSCRNRILFSTTQKGKRCDAPRRGSGGALLVSDKYLGEFNARVSVCGPLDAAGRPGLCRAAGATVKPEGALQAAGKRLRIGVMSYLSEAGAADDNAYGGALRAALGPPEAVIGFINRFGRSNPQRLGAYRANDPGAELFYEALRYLQARPPGVTAPAGADDGLPVLNTRADPVLGACQRNVIATIGHPAFANDRFVPGNTRALFGDLARDGDGFAAARFDVMAATRTVGEMEADVSGAYGNPSPRPGLRQLETLGAGPGGRGSHYLAGAAYWAHVNPIRPDKPVKVDSMALELGVPASGGGSALYLAAKYGGFDDRNGDGNPFVTSGNRRDSSEWSSDGATPAAFFAGAQPQAIAGAVQGMVDAAGAARMANDGPSVVWQGKGGAFLISTIANLASGAGTVRKTALTISAGGGVRLAAQPSWDAAELLDGNPRKSPAVPTAAVEARRIFTSDGRGATIPFAWPQLPPQVRAMLDGGDGLGELRTAFLRGERSREIGRPGGMFRKRASVMGDILHSVPLVAGKPAPVVYVGANAGMLHALSAADGTELFAYIPAAVLPRLGELANAAYAPGPYVDGSPAAGDVVLGGAQKQVLVSGMGMGARGVFALDISDPSAFGKGQGALWEFTEQDDPAIGHIHAAPVIATIARGSGSRATMQQVAIVAGGINPMASDGSGALFLLVIDKPPGEPWREGVNYYKLTTPRGDPALPNALSAPAVARGADGSALYAYAGDLQGSLWRFDLRVMTVRRLFTARADGVQPIAHAPKVVFAPGGGYLVIFGTGKFIERADTERASFTQQSLYAIHDRLAADPAAPASRADLARRNLAPSGTGYAVKGEAIDYFAPGAPRGWYADFADARNDGERAAGSPAAVSGAILLPTLLPGADACAGVRHRQYVLDAATGMAIGEAGMSEPDAVTGKLSPSGAQALPMLVELGSSTGARNATGGAWATRLLGVLSVRTGEGGMHLSTVKVRYPARRLGWREVANWLELHEAASTPSK